MKQLSRALKERDEARRERDEALAFQAASNEILAAISRSTSDAKPVFDAIVDCVRRLFGTRYVAVFLVKGEELHLAAAKSDAHFEREKAGVFRRFRDSFPQRIDWGGFTGKALRSGKVSQIAPIIGNPKATPQAVKLAKQFGYNAMLVAPLVRDGKAIGAIGTTRPEPEPFAARELALFKAFAAQAVVAIENARLFNETKEALEHQKASAETLRVISSSPGDIMPVFRAVAESAARLCNALNVHIRLVEGDLMPVVAHVGPISLPPQALAQRISPKTVAGRAIIERRTIHLHDVTAPEVRSEYPEAGFLSLGPAFRTVLVVPMVRDDTAIGTITIRRAQVQPFSEPQIKLLQTFADQAVIAIENARLFNETKEALEQQTATSEVLRVISGTPADPQPVFEAIAQSAARVFNAPHTGVALVEGDSLRLRATAGRVDPRGHMLIPFDRTSSAGSALLERRIVDVPDTEAVGALPFARVSGRAVGFRAIASAPMLREGQGIGVITVMRAQPGALTDKQHQLLQTFADQAVIAIENARLFNETKEALERQTATSDVLRVISASPTDVQPVLDSIAERAAILCNAKLGFVGRFDGKLLHMAAFHGASGESLQTMRALYPMDPRTGGSVAARVVRSRAPVQIADVFADPEYAHKAAAQAAGYRGALGVPLLREGEIVGAIIVVRAEAGLFPRKQVEMLETFADQAVIAIENARLFNETKEALEQQTASSEILRVISRTPGDVQPVFDSIVNNCSVLFRDSRVALWQISEGALTPRASTGYMPEPIPLDRGSAIGACVLESRTLHLPDLRSGAEQYPRVKQLGLKHGYLSGVYAPLLREGQAIGGISVLRRELGAFSDKEVALLSTFADQAVIAIENARLFNETKEALEQQTAISEVLRVISSSPTDVKPVLDAVAMRAARICDATDARIFLTQDDHFKHAAGFGDVGVIAELIPLNRDTPSGRAIIDRAPQHIHDIAARSDFVLGREIAARLGWRTILSVPLLREDRALGTIVLRRKEVRPFSEKQVALLKTFADQAAIAIENARLFNETKEALEQQTSTADILKVISGSPTSLQPVFETIARNAVRLCDAVFCNVLRFDGELLHVAAHHGFDPAFLDRLHSMYPMKPDVSQISGRVIRERAVVHIPDATADALYDRRYAAAGGWRRMLGVPMLREGRPLGVVVVVWKDVGATPEPQVRLLQTFADQAAIAIENVRLFNETKEALEQQTASAEILKVISASPSDVQPVFDAVAETAARVCGVDDVAILRTEGNDLRRVAHYGSVPVTPDSRVPVPRGSVNERVLSEHRTLHIPDTLAPSFTREFPGSQFPAMGVRALLATPLVHDGVAVGVIHLRRSEPRPFTDKQIALLETFAAQAVIAIENVRLFNETRDALERQTATGEILASMSESMTDTKPVFDAIVRNLLRLFGSGYAVVSLRRGQVNELAGFQGEPGFERLGEVYPIPVDEHTISGEAMLSRQVKKYAPVVGNPAVPRRTAELGQRFGFNSIMTAPMMWKGEAIGVILTARRQPLPFDDKQVALIQSFADQAVIAIENVRLFKELQERTESLTRSVDQLTALGEVGRAISSMLELDEVLRTIVQRAVQLAGMDAGSIYEFDARDQRFHLRAAQNVAEDILTVYRKSPIRMGEGAIGRAGATREPVMVEDVLNESYRSRAREALIKSGVRALLAVPLLGEELVLGALVVSRKSPGPFAREVIDLLNTFATQSAVAIQNARLFREIAEKSIQLEEASRHKSQFLASMSHELRTPLNAILGFNEMILGQVYGEVPPDMKEPLEDIQKSGKHLLRLINNVLDLAKIEAGRMELALADYSVQDTVESVRSTLRPLAEAKGLELVASVPEDIPLAYGDGGRLTQCLMNLAGNSLKFTKQGRVEIAVEAQNGLLRWRVSDTGIGIPPDKIPTLFSEFKQTDATIASEYGGTGLGLSITKKFVEMHGGRISVESELGKGSAFTIEIPLRATARA